MFEKVKSVLRFLLRKKSWESDLDRELRYHLERQTEENIHRGMSSNDACATALRTLGAVEQLKEECRDARLGRAIEATLQDIRYGARVLRKNPGFAFAAIITLALGIGVNTAIFSVVYGVLLRPLPYRQGGQLVVLHQLATRAHLNDIPFSAKEIFDYRDQNHTLQGVVEHHTMYFLLLGRDWAERVNTAVVSANFFDVLGVRPLLGRTFLPSDDDKNAESVLILSYKYWQTRFGADPNVVGQVFQMNNRPHRVIGVLPPIPQYPQEADVYMPTSACPFRSDPKFIADRNSRMMIAFGRLRPGVSLQKAQADLSTIAGRLTHAYPESYPKSHGYNISATPLSEDLTYRARNTFLVLLGASAFVLLIACANVANLLLARVLKLERELAVRTALGATKLRLVRQLLTESILLSLAGGALGVLAAPAALTLLVKFAERFTTRASEVEIDAPVLFFALALSLLTGIVFGLIPAWGSSRQIGDTLRQGFARITSTYSHQRFRGALVVAQVAVSIMLLVGAGLLMRSFLKLQQVNPGFRPGHLLTMRLSVDFSRYKDADVYPLMHNLLEQVKAISAVESEALASNFPFNPGRIAQGPLNQNFRIEGRHLRKGELEPAVDYIFVSPDYFQTLRQPMIRGRVFTLHDDEKAPSVAIINQSMARHRWPSEDPIGKRITFDQGKTWTKIVGIAGDTTEYGPNHPVEDEVYLPVDQTGFSGDLIMRTAADPMSLVPFVRAAIRKVDTRLAIDRVNTIDHFEEDTLASPRITTMLVALFAILAVVISASGIAAVMTLAVRQRTHELGIRMALGASRDSVLRMIVRQGLGLAFAGTVVGIAGAIALTRLLASLLYATSPTDALTFVAMAVFFLAVAAIASWVPARQVTGIDPVVALRQE